MIWLQNEEERKIYQAIGVIPKDFNEFDKTNLLKKNQVNDQEYILVPEWTENVETEVWPGRQNSYSKDDSKIVTGLKCSRLEKGYVQTFLKYYHPLYLTMCICNMLKDTKEVVSLLGFFEKFVDNNTESEIAAFKKAKQIITSLDESSIDNETFKSSVLMMWPVLGYFATELYENIVEIAPLENGCVHTYDEIDTIKENIDICHKRNITIEYNQMKQYNTILEASKHAEYNKEVLALVKKIKGRLC